MSPSGKIDTPDNNYFGMSAKYYVQFSTSRTFIKNRAILSKLLIK